MHLLPLRIKGARVVGTGFAYKKFLRLGVRSIAMPTCHSSGWKDGLVPKIFATVRTDHKSGPFHGWILVDLFRIRGGRGISLLGFPMI